MTCSSYRIALIYVPAYEVGFTSSPQIVSLVRRSLIGAFLFRQTFIFNRQTTFFKFLLC